LIRDLGANPESIDAEIRILDNLRTKNYAALMDLSDDVRFQFIEGDILDLAVVAYALQNVDLVVHLAVIVQTPMSFENPTWLEPPLENDSYHSHHPGLKRRTPDWEDGPGIISLCG